MTAEATLQALDVVPVCTGNVMADVAELCSVPPSNIVLGTDYMGEDRVAVYLAVCPFHRATAREYFGQALGEGHISSVWQSLGAFVIPFSSEALQDTIREDLLAGRITGAWQMLPRTAMAG